jgi:hypothetical protein
VGVVLIPASGASAAVNHCKLPKRAQEIDRSLTVIAYSVPNGEGDKTLYGCLRATGARSKILVGSDDGIESYSKFNTVIVNGRFIAFQIEDYDISCKADCPPGYNPYTYTLARFDVKRRKPYQVTGQAEQGAFFVSGKLGKLAWIQSSPVGFEVHVNKATLDQGAIDPKSLKLVGTTLSWTNAGTPQSTTLR